VDSKTREKATARLRASGREVAAHFAWLAWVEEGGSD